MRTPEEEGQRVLPEFVEKSGGILSMFGRDFGRQGGFSQKELLDIVAFARPLYMTMREFYQLEIELPEEVDKPRKWKLEVFTERGKKRNRPVALYPELFPCSAGHQPLN